MAVGLYISVPFCKTKCSYCNFASDVFSRNRLKAYVNRLVQDIESARRTVEANGGKWEAEADSVYLGGGTPSILEPPQMRQIFGALRRSFNLATNSEITVECAPGALSPEMLETLVDCGVNRISLGVQSFVDQEARAVGRLHTREQTLSDIANLRATDIFNLNVDLIAGLPHQSAESWEVSLKEVLDSGVPHVSVYLLEVDEDSRLGSELLAGGARYHAHFVPDEGAMVEFYSHSCDCLAEAGIHQYEISNFARPGLESRHNLKYWKRQPYLGFGLDAHSMLRSAAPQLEAVRLATPDSLPAYLAAYDDADQITRVNRTEVGFRQAWEETFFLGLRLNSGVDLKQVENHFGRAEADSARIVIRELAPQGLVEMKEDILRLTPAGRLLSNEIFEEFLSVVTK